MINTELMENTKVRKNKPYRIKNRQNVTTAVLLRICNALNFDIEEFIECVEYDFKKIWIILTG